MTQTNSKPAATIRDGAIKATIWPSTAENGPDFSTKLTRTWVDDQGNFHDSDRLSGTDLLKASRILAKAYDREVELKQATNQTGSS